MSRIHSNLKSVLIQHDPNLSIRKLAKEINYHFDSVRRMYKDEMVQYPRDLLLKLCTYFNVEPGQLIIINHEETSEDTASDFGGNQEEYRKSKGQIKKGRENDPIF